ncbi:hypothetical protein [Mucilaginibacter xinganensis]|uniref:Uncharacterized protein n=1 Tax=Mucilaginibacter xinganensis TaxID=1234841 RepID=A0A223NXF1_9SPHI|nr:hypothetical protein [Mucilaginibacter xinganensis]ASU34374.1 hypothetical protein MuYL_2487 [Mucilaginibacter xinganensis]
MKADFIEADRLLMNSYEDEQYALVFYLKHGNPGPVLKQIAEERIKDLEFKKSKMDPVKYYPVKSPMPRLEFERECETVGTCKKELL